MTMPSKLYPVLQHNRKLSAVFVCYYSTNKYGCQEDFASFYF